MDIKTCPFCGHTFDAGLEIGKALFPDSQGTKWGCLQCPSCSGQGPEVRTGYDVSDDAEWHGRAIKEWNERET